MNRILQVFLDTDMRNSHEGLKLLAKREGVKVEKLEDGEHCVFINTKGNRIKILSSRNIVSYMLSTSKLELGALKYFSDCYGARGFEYSNALRKVLTEKLARKKPLTEKQEKYVNRNRNRNLELSV